ncbi:MAG: DUF5642 family protein [Mycobacterium sp.]
MRVFALCAVMTLCAACGGAKTAQAPSSTSVPTTASAAEDTFSIANVARARTSLPPGYEVSSLPADATPIALWGLGDDWTSEPGHCAGLAEPVGVGAAVSGWSASGPGGIVYVVAATADDGVAPAVFDDCVPWSIFTDHTAATIRFDDAPRIADVSTLGLVTDMATQVEGGTETHSRAQTFTADLGGCAAYVVVVTDPGSVGQPLAPHFAADLLVETVAALRG